MLGWFKKTFGRKADDQVAEPPVDEGLTAGQATVVEAAGEPVPVEVTPEIEPEFAGTGQSPQAAIEIDPAEAIEPEPIAAEPEPELASEPAAAASPDSVVAAAETVPPAPLPEEAEPVPLLLETADAEPETPAPVAEVELHAQEQLEESDQPDVEPEAERATVADVLDRAKSRTQEKPGPKSMFQRLQDRLGKTRDAWIYRLDRLFLGKKEIDQELFEQLEEILITADLGVATTLDLLDRARKKVKREQLSDPQALKTILRDEILTYIEDADQPAELVLPEEGPFVIMVVGVNGVGKTTTIGKIAAKFVRSGQSVLLVAADTFRAAAINQLRVWGERVGVEVVAQKPGADPSSVVFDGLEYGLAHGREVIIIDTAGRLHTSVNLMEELKKIRRVIGKKLPGAPHEVLLVLDATTGQNGITQAKIFHEAVGVSGLALTKLDGTAKGGIVANVCREIRIPVRFIGIGEQIDDLRDFDAREFVEALFSRQEH